MGQATDERLAAERAALEARYLDWFYRALEEDRLDCAPVPAEFHVLTEPAGA